MSFFTELQRRKVYQVAVIYNAGHIGYPVSQQRREIIA